MPPPEMEIYDTLRTWRGEEAKAKGVPHYMILNNRQMAEVAKLKPQSINALQTISGIGKSKAKTFGEAIIELIAQMGKPNQVAQEPVTGESAPTQGEQPTTPHKDEPPHS